MKANRFRLSVKNLIYFLAFLKLVIPFFLQSPIYELHRDEYLYLAEAHHMAWGYLEVPPLLSVLAWISIFMGNSIYVIKFWPALFSSLTFLLCARMVLSLGGKKFAIFLVWLPFIFGVYLRLFYLFQPNFLEVFFWTSMSYCLFNFIKTEKNIWLYGFGISLGLGLLSKHSSIFYLVGILAGILFTPYRELYRNKHFYMAGIVSLLIFFPNFLWEFDHNFPFVHHMKELQEEQLKYLNSADFLKNQIFMSISYFFIWIAGIIYLILNKEGENFRIFFYSYWITMILFIVFHGKDYYTLGLYPILFVFGSVYLEKLTLNRYLWIRYAMVINVFVVGLFFLPALIPVFKPDRLKIYYEKTGISKTGFLIWEDQKSHPLPQDFSDMLGWKELSVKASKVYLKLSNEERKQTIFFCDDYGTAGAITYFAPGLKIPDPISDASNFILNLPIHVHFKNLILIRRTLPVVSDDIHNGFEKVILMDSLSTPYSREIGMKVLLLKNIKPKLLSYLCKKWGKERLSFER